MANLREKLENQAKEVNGLKNNKKNDNNILLSFSLTTRDS